jgi:hypothetical protein
MFVIAAGRYNRSVFSNRITKEASTKILEFYQRAAQALRNQNGFVIAAEPLGAKCGWGILRVGYADRPNLAAIGTAVLDLDQFARSHPTWSFRMSYPGLEELAQETVEPVISILPDNVTACVYTPIARLAPGKMDTKDVYWIVQNHILYGRHELARDFLSSIGWGNPLDQIAAVARDGVEEFAWRQAQKPFRR